MLDGDTIMNPHTYRVALRAAGAAIAGVDAVMKGEVENVFCAVRPPGHHAEPTRSMGFCLFDNVAIAARYAMETYGIERVAIIDFDVHHGNGTEAAFFNDPNVLMCSFFQHPFYPYSGLDHANNMVNVPLPASTRGDVVRSIVEERWLPALRNFEPELVIVSAGFDAHREDDLGQMGLVEDDYAWITKRLKEIANDYAQGRIVSCLEGGYNLSALGRSVVAHVKALADI
jgi:acetoin utilization deacetylase AcuC-like enzyme